METGVAKHSADLLSDDDANPAGGQGGAGGGGGAGAPLLVRAHLRCNLSNVPRWSRGRGWGGHGGALGPFHPLLILSNINAAARREREKAPESKAIRPPELFEVLSSVA